MEIIAESISRYMDFYKETCSKKRKPRLPVQLSCKDDTVARLSALYALAVEDMEHECNFDENTTDRIDQVASWLHDSPKHGLLLRGTLGNGKTTMLKAVSSLFGCRATRVNAKRVYDMFRRTESAEYYPETLLLIDDLGAEPERCMIYGVEYHPLSDIMLYRYEHNLTTVIATNLSFDEIRARYGDRVYDRMIETFDAIMYDTPSYRGVE